MNYNNQELIDALKDRDEVIKGLTSFELDDEQLEKIDRFKQLSQFEKDLLYLRSQLPVSQIASLYGVSIQYIYKLIKNIKI